MQDLYRDLELERGASPEEIRKAYLRLAKAKHPDKGGDPEEFKRIQKGYDVLSDQQKRKIYDETGSTDVDAHGGGGMPQGFEEMLRHMGMGGGFMSPGNGGGMGGPFGHGIPTGVSFDMGDIFSQMFHGGGSGGGRNQGPSKQPKGENKHHSIGLSLSDFYKGREIPIRFNQARFCTSCSGTGGHNFTSCTGCGGRGVVKTSQQVGPSVFLQNTSVCGRCNGEGKKSSQVCMVCGGNRLNEREKTLDVKVLPGMRAGQTIVFPNECSDSMDFERPGDVILHLEQADSDGLGYVWREEDLFLTITITVGEAMLGFQKIIEDHPSGSPLVVSYKGRPLKHGSKILIAGKGMPRRIPGEYGNLIIAVDVHVPTELRADQVAMLKVVFAMGSYKELQSGYDTIEGVYAST